MFSNLLRSQARLSLLTVARTAAVPASRSLSSLLLRQTVAGAAVPTVSRLAVARAFSSGSVLAFEGERRVPKNPPTSTVYVGNMPWDMTTEDMNELFSEFGTVLNTRIQTGSDGRPRGFGHITFASVEDASAAVSSAAEEPLHVAGRDLVVDFARTKDTSVPEAQPNKKLYFARFNAGELGLRELLADFKSDIVSIYFIRDGNTGEKLNAGFIEFSDVGTATTVLNQMNGTETDDGYLSLSYARPRRPDDKYNARKSPNRRDQGKRSKGY